MLSNLFSKSSRPSIQWNQLTAISDLEEIDNTSLETPVLIFKHSTRCPISTMSLGKFERNYSEEAAFKPYFLDLIAYRDISNEIANRYGVIHESPQAILISKKKSIYDASHNGIDFAEIAQKSSDLV